LQVTSYTLQTTSYKLKIKNFTSFARSTTGQIDPLVLINSKKEIAHLD
jgi:hypothetical protein